MKEFTHLVISRINCDYPEDPLYPPRLYERVAEKQFSREWLEERLGFMQKFTLPSVRAQTSQKFRWIILLHPRTPEDLIDRFKEHEDNKTRVVMTDLSPREFLPGFIQETVKTSWVATTTLDADDAVSNSYFEFLQGKFRKTREYLNVTRGFNYVIDTSRFYGRKGTANPFITLVEPTKTARGVYCVIHGAATLEAPVIQLESPGVCWVQVAHGGNLLNKKRVGGEHKGRPYTDYELKNMITVNI